VVVVLREGRAALRRFAAGLKREKPSRFGEGLAASSQDRRLAPTRGSELGGDVREGARQLGADRGHGGDGGDGDERSDQAIFDGGGAGLILGEASEEGLHWGQLLAGVEHEWTMAPRVIRKVNSNASYVFCDGNLVGMVYEV